MPPAPPVPAPGGTAPPSNLTWDKFALMFLVSIISAVAIYFFLNLMERYAEKKEEELEEEVEELDDEGDVY